MASPPRDLVAQLATPAFGSVTLVSADELTDWEKQSTPPWWIEATLMEGSHAVTYSGNKPCRGLCRNF